MCLRNVDYIDFSVESDRDFKFQDEKTRLAIRGVVIKVNSDK